ncbi:autism susceptibility gene 2 protein-like isoform X2 [Antedon mediterranea]|uniref:autism susceptibility gene 2 protein-like isoform X2 n=1 Tax=Antedon mediterranea TaxID=105859 RepID=UPI003AF92403
MENETKPRSRTRRRQRAQEMRQAKQQNHNEGGSGDEEESPPQSRERERGARYRTVKRHEKKKSESSSSSCSSGEEFIIDGFAVAAYTSLDALETGQVVKPRKLRQTLEDGTNIDREREREHKGRKKQPTLKKTRSPHRVNRPADENTRPEVVAKNGPNRPNSRLSDESSHTSSGRGYICDVESEEDTRNSDTESDLFLANLAPNRNKPVLPPKPLLQTNAQSQDIYEREPCIQREPDIPIVASAPVSVPIKPCLPVVQELSRDREQEREQREREEEKRERERERERRELEIQRERERRERELSEQNRGFTKAPGWPNVTKSITPSVAHLSRSTPTLPYSAPSQTPTFSHSSPIPPNHSVQRNMYTPSLPPPPPLTSPTNHNQTPFAAAADTGYNYSKGPLTPLELHNRNLNNTKGQQHILRKELDKRFLAAHDRSMSVGPPPYMRTETHMHQHNHMHQHMHSHSFLPTPVGSALVPPQPPPHMLGVGFPPNLPAIPPPTSVPSQIGMPPNSAFQPKKQGKWCAAHVTVAWLIYHQQQKKAEAQKDQLKPDIFSRPAAQLMPPQRPSEHSAPPGLFPPGGPSGPHSALGGPHPSGFIAQSAGQLGMPPFPRPQSYGPIGTPVLPRNGLGNGITGSMFNGRDMLGLHGNHLPYNRLHRTPPGFPTPPPPSGWPKPDSKDPLSRIEMERERKEEEARKERERERVKESLDQDKERPGERPGKSSTSPDRWNNDNKKEEKDRHMDGREKNIDRDGEHSKDLIPKLNDHRTREGSRSPSTHHMHRRDIKESAFDSVGHCLTNKEERREYDVAKERSIDQLHRDPLHPGIAAVGSMFERRGLGIFPPSYAIERPPPGIPMMPWDARDNYIRSRQESFQREHAFRQEYERDRMLRSAAAAAAASGQPMGPIIEQERFRDREPHDFTRDNPLAVDSYRSRIEQERLHVHQRLLEERVLREEAERNRMLQVAHEHGQMMIPSHPALPPSLHNSLPYSRSSNFFQNSIMLKASQPPPLVPTASINSTFGSSQRSRGPSPSTLQPNGRNNSPLDSLASKEKALSEKDAHSR